jgi:hypothetical protein
LVLLCIRRSGCSEKGHTKDVAFACKTVLGFGKEGDAIPIFAQVRELTFVV